MSFSPAGTMARSNRKASPLISCASSITTDRYGRGIFRVSSSDLASRIRSMYSFLPCSFLCARDSLNTGQMRFFTSPAQACAATQSSGLDVLLHGGDVQGLDHVFPFRPIEALG